MSTLKEQKQQFVSDLLGGPLHEIYAVVAVPVLAYMTFKSLTTTPSMNHSLLLDFLFNVVVLLVAITVYSNRISYLYQVLLIPSLGLILFQKLNSELTKSKSNIKSNNKFDKSEKSEKSGDILKPKPFITTYRSHMLILTNLAILAVDFHIFPRRFAKVETWGTSIMDMGVGSFVFSMGLVNSRSIIKQKLQTGKPRCFNLSSYIQLIITNFRKALPMLILGFIRFVSVKGLEYQEHVTEYGVHWNFFITLGLLPVFIAILDPLFELLPRCVIALLIIVVYEVCLVKTDLLLFILRSDNRTENFFTMNKEGIFSFWGYLSIFIFGQSFGSFVLTSTPTCNNLITFDQTLKPKTKSKINRLLTVSTTKGLIISTIAYQLISYFINQSPMFYNISRRLANLPYVFMIIAYNSFFLLCYNIVDALVNTNGTNSLILDSVNKNGLVFFLIGNLLTGLVNICINTLERTPRESFAILLLYGLVLAAIPVLLDHFGIYIKL